MKRAAARIEEDRRLLELPARASLQDVKRAYRRLAAKHHPDRNAGDPERMAPITAAYRRLTALLERTPVDLAGAGGTPEARLAARFDGDWLASGEGIRPRRGASRRGGTRKREEAS